MTSADLFPAATSASPRLRWLAKHGLMTRHYDGPHGCGGPEGPGWICGNVARTRNAGGESMREAEMAYAARYGIKHWLVDDWERAMEVTPQDFHNVTREWTNALCTEAIAAMEKLVGEMGRLPCQNPGCGNTIVDHSEERCRTCGHCVEAENLDE